MDLLEALRAMGDGVHDDLSVAHEAAREIERLRKDAERYRWLRSHGLDRSNGFYHISWYQQYDDDYPCSNDEIDAAIDAAMREGE